MVLLVISQVYSQLYIARAHRMMCGCGFLSSRGCLPPRKLVALGFLSWRVCMFVSPRRKLVNDVCPVGACLSTTYLFAPGNEPLCI